MLRALLQLIGIAGIAFIATIFLYSDVSPFNRMNLAYTREPMTQSAAVVVATSSSQNAEIEPPATSKPASKATKPKTEIKITNSKDTPKNNGITPATSTNAISAETLDSLNTEARNALVNIFCKPTGGILQAISGSGVIIDPRGVILTNAHVAQYVLLASSQKVDLSCVVRTGSPAQAHWEASILYMPSVWVEEHAKDIKNVRPLGTGENDYALLLITDSVDGTPLPGLFPYVPADTHQSADMTGNTVLLAAYPAEFAGGSATLSALNISTAVTTIRQLLTFQDQTIDLISLGGISLAQSGSSGGGVVNVQGRLVGIISTTSEGETTAERDLRAITLSYIDRSLAANTTKDLHEILTRDVRADASDFMQTKAPALAQSIISELTPKQ